MVEGIGSLYRRDSGSGCRPLVLRHSGGLTPSRPTKGRVQIVPTLVEERRIVACRTRLLNEAGQKPVQDRHLSLPPGSGRIKDGNNMGYVKS